ncbi:MULTISPECIES: zinc-dependent alcohol dehydrogenase family protein [unclassified Bradyrhizobium]
MRVVRLKSPGGLDNLVLMEEDAPKPRPDELLVKIRACSLNLRDDFIVLGKTHCADDRIPLSDGAGDVIAVGEAVDEFKVGDAVVSTFYPHWQTGEMTSTTKREIPGDTFDGFARDYVCMPAHGFTKAPAGYTHVEAATLTCAGVTAWRGLVVCGQVKPGDTVLVIGAGSVSLFALQFAKAAGAQVIATSSSDERLEKLKSLGADMLINYKAAPDWGQKAKDLTDGRGVDHVIEVGGPATLAQSITACRTGGHIALIGVLTGFAGELVIPAVFSNQIRISGISIGSRADQSDMIRSITVNRPKPVIDRTFALDEIVAAFKYHEARKYFGKVCLEL